MRTKDMMWDEAVKRKIQQVREEWEWLISKLEDKHGFNLINILEIGCYDGGSSWYLNNFSRNMITVDCNNPARFDSSGFRGNYEYVGRDSHHWETVEYFKKYEWNFVFIDGDHSYEGVKADFNNVLPLLKKGTLVAFHDVVISDFHHIHGCYVGEFWNDLKQERPDFKFEQITTNDEWAGIGLVEI